ncbi:MAG: hypothetical protein K8U57_22995 [Planctomycetes bacterium]|nr:hypothetical protein [Planctomycetota bacterium]
MSRTKNAALTSAFALVQYVLALVSGFVLFPLTIWYLGAYDNGLWLVTGELAGYLLLGDLGVFAVLPWLIATKDGADDRRGVARYLADSLGVGVVVGAGFVAIAGGIWSTDSALLGVNPEDWSKVRGPLSFVLVLIGVGFPFRAFTALLGGLQDVAFVGWVNLGQNALAVALTATLVPLGYGLRGLAVAVSVPPLIGGLAAMVRVFTCHRENAVGWFRPEWVGCRHLVGQGFGAWLGGLGVRLLTSSSGLVFAALGRPDWATVYAATGKAAQVVQPLCLTLPDSGLVGLSQLRGEGNADRTRRVVLCLLLLYLFIPGTAAIGLLTANRWFVNTWLGPGFYAGDTVNNLIAANLIFSVATGGLFKVVGVVGYRVAIGLAAVFAGFVAVSLGYGLGRYYGVAGVAGASLVAYAVVILPFGLYSVQQVHGISPRELLGGCATGWAVRTVPLLFLAAWAGQQFEDRAAIVLLLATLLTLGNLLAVRSLVGKAPWPDHLRAWLIRLRLIPTKPRQVSSDPPGTSP